MRVLDPGFTTICGEVENPKPEARNPKQYRMIQIQMTKTMAPKSGLAEEICLTQSTQGTQGRSN
jgi:hypothetical protein